MSTKKSLAKQLLEITVLIIAVITGVFVIYDRMVGKIEPQKLDVERAGESSTLGGWDYPSYWSTTGGWDYPSYYSPSTSYFDNVTSTSYYTSPGSTFENFTSTPSQKPP